MKSILKLSLAVVVAFTTLAFTNVSFAQNLKIGVVDVALVVESMPEAAQGEKYIKEVSTKYQDTLLQMQKNLEEKVAQYRKQQAMMPKDQQTKTEEELQGQNQQLVGYQQSKFSQGGELSRIRESILTPLREKVIAAIKEVAKTEKMNFIFEKTNGSVLHSDDKFDITFSVIDKIKRGSGEKEDKK
ncbi:MAG: OmpH family outer membrane protein [Candidatus Kapaibacteriota bacterium]|jgi:outer membrane protein